VGTGVRARKKKQHEDGKICAKCWQGASMKLTTSRIEFVASTAR
jgi:hypothetical protein